MIDVEVKAAIWPWLTLFVCHSMTLTDFKLVLTGATLQATLLHFITAFIRSIWNLVLLNSMKRLGWKILLKRIKELSFISNKTIYRAITITKNKLKPPNLKPSIHWEWMDHLCIWFLGKKSCPPWSSPPILPEITLLQLHCNRTKKHLVLNGNANFHMATFCGWDHLASCLQSSSPHSQMITSQRPTLLLCLLTSLTL